MSPINAPTCTSLDGCPAAGLVFWQSVVGLPQKIIAQEGRIMINKNINPKSVILIFFIA